MILIREPDAGAGWRFLAVRAGNAAKAVLTGNWRQTFHFRTAEEWTACFSRLGFRVDVRGTGEGTPFANVLVRRSPGRRASLREAADLDDLELAGAHRRSNSPPNQSAQAICSSPAGGSNDRLERARVRAAPDPSRSGYPTTAPACAPRHLRQRHGEPQVVRAEKIAHRRERSRAADAASLSGPTGHDNTSCAPPFEPALQTRT